MLKIGVLGAGHLGKIHIKCIKEIGNYKLIGFYDPDKNTTAVVEKELGIKHFNSLDNLIDNVDVVDIVTPTISHYDCAVLALKKTKHVFIEKPIVETLEEAKDLIKIAREANVKVQVGHVERFNPAFIAAKPFLNQPMFIETHRLAMFNPRGTDVPVVLDLMIHDIDIVLSVVNSDIKKISASGVHVVSQTPDIANARLEFDNGCVANFTSSRISMKNMRKSRFFQRNAYISVDYLNKKVETIQLKDVDKNNIDPLAMTINIDENKNLKQVFFYYPDIKPLNAIKAELESFSNAIINDTTPIVTMIDGYNALNVAYKIIDKFKYTLNNI